MVELASDPTPSPNTSSNPTAVDAIAGWANEGRLLRRWARLLPALTGVAATLILAAVALRLWLADVRGGELLVWAGALLVLASLAYLSQHVLDRYILGKTRSLVENLTAQLDEFAVAHVGERLEFTRARTEPRQ